MKRYVAILAILMLLVPAALGGCSSAVTSPTAAPASAAAATTATPEQTPAPLKDLTLKVYRASFGTSAQGTEVEKLWLEKAAAYAGVKLSISFSEIPYDDMGEKSEIYLAAGDFPDIFQTRTDLTTINNLGQAGTILNFKKFEADLPNLKAILDAGANRLSVMDGAGNWYCVPTTNIITNLYGTQWDWLIRADVFKANGLKPPTTADELYQVCKTLKEKYPNSYPIGSTIKDGWYSVERVLLMINHMDVPDSLCFENGKYFYGPFDKEAQFKQTVEYLKKLYDEKLLDPEFFSNTMDQALQKGVNDVNFIFPNGFMEFAWHQLSTADKPNVQWAVAPRIKAFDGSVGWKPGSNAQPYTADFTLITCVNAKVAEPDAVCKLLDYSFTPDSITLRNYGIEGTTYTKNADGTLAFMDIISKSDNPRAEAAKFGIDLSMSCRSGLVLGPQDVDGGALLDKQPLCYIDGDYKAGSAYAYTAKYDGGKDSVFPADTALPIILTQDDKDLQASSFTPIATFMTESMTKFITGQLPMTEWDATIAKAKAIGNYQAVLDTYNARYAEAQARAAALGIK